MVKIGAESGESLLELCFNLGNERRNRECELVATMEKGWLVETSDNSICGHCNA